MSDNEEWTFSTPESSAHGSTDHTGSALTWVDGRKRPWTVELTPGKVVLRSGSDVLEIAEDRWGRDVYVAGHGESYVIRFQTFDQEIGFLVSAKRAEPFLRHLADKLETADERIEEEVHPTADDAPLMWPRVSPLAVWALICSSLVFLPVIGLVLVIPTVTCLVLHRKTVRHSRVMSHSRKICTVAFVFMLLGLVVSALATLSMATNTGQAQLSGLALPGPADALRVTEVGSDDEGGSPLRSLAGQPILAQGVFGEEHNWGLIIAGLVVILFSLTIHECGHATTAWWCGDDTARQMGRVTLNPRAHIDPFGTIILPLILFMMGGGVFGWAKPVPVQTLRLRNPRRDDILVSIAGPGSNLLLAAASLGLLLGLQCIVRLTVPGAQVESYPAWVLAGSVQASGFLLAPVFSAVSTVLILSFTINVCLAFFNLIPLPPLDGSWVLQNMFPQTLGPLYARIRPFGFLLFLALIFSGLLRLYFGFVAYCVIIPAWKLLIRCTGFF